MTEADTESIWDATLDTARFTKIGVRIAAQLNFWINDDATNQVTNTAVTPILAQLSEEILMDIIASSKLNAVTNPWDFIQANVTRASRRVLANYGDILKKIREILGQTKIELTRRTLPGSATDW
jgi:hypothetical protein